MRDLRFAIFGTGFWARFQLAGWCELKGAECVALYNRTRSKAAALAQEFGIPAVYDDPEELLRHEEIDTEEGTLAKRHAPPRYAWADPAYDVVHSAIVPCNADLLRALQTGVPAETSGEDNLKTMCLVFGAYESARTREVLHLQATT